MITKRWRSPPSPYTFVALGLWMLLTESLHAAWLGKLMLSVECWLNWVEAINPLCHLLMVPEDSSMFLSIATFFFFYLQAILWSE